MRQLARYAALLVGVLALAAWAHADVAPGSLFTDNMVLQREQPLPIYGTASPGESVTVRYGEHTGSGTAGPDGQWRITLPALQADSVGRNLVIAARNTITLTNVVVGDVYVCSGQSNMAFSLLGAHNGVQETAAANYPLVRLFTVGANPSPVPLDNCGGNWKVCAPATAGNFSAVGYFFGREINRRTHIPIGLINSSWGGMPAETYTSIPALEAMPRYHDIAAAQAAKNQDYIDHKAMYDTRRAAEVKDYNDRFSAWYDKELSADPGTTGHWADPDFAPMDWKSITLPVVMGSNPLGDYMGSIWHRKTVAIPQTWVGKKLVVHDGAVDDVDDTYVNGVHIGQLFYDVPNFWTLPRAYDVPASLVTSTSVTVTVRAFNLVGDIGMFGPAAEMYLACPSVDSNRVSIAGDWMYQHAVAVAQADVPQQNYTPIPGANAGDPAALYNGMINPLTSFPIRGVIWYQGESNAGDPAGYRELFPGMIASWRTAWGESDFQFAFVQLANFMGRQSAPVELNGWADIRESQMRTLSTPNTAMAVIIDIGEANDIHPKDKQDVGLRLALPILAKAYGRHLEYSGPLYNRMEVRGSRILIKLDYDKGLAAHGPELTGFAIAGPDHVFHFAHAVITNGGVEAWSDKVPTPVAVRYAWANNPVCNLYNGAGLPASPFRTDDWQPGTFTAANEPMPW